MVGIMGAQITCDSLGPVFNGQLAIKVFQMKLDGVQRDTQFVGDLNVCVTFRKGDQQLLFAAGERAEAAGARWISYNSDMSAFAPNASGPCMTTS